MEKEILLTIKNLRVGYCTEGKTAHALNGIDLTIHSGETLGLVGETGAGKTTTALSILKLLPNPGRVSRMDADEMTFQGLDLLHASETEMHAIRGDLISMIFQDPMTSLNPVLSIGAQIAEAVQLHSGKISKAEVEQEVERVLRMVGIPPERKREYPHQFSGGMKQRVVIAMALANSPQLLIADEPTSALDVTIQAQVMEMIQDLIEKQGTSLILITHDLGLVATSCDDVAVVYAGEIIEYGSNEEIYDHPSHPYTIGLFGAIPNLESDVRRLANIEGLPPDPSNLPTGCSFAPRCPYATEECRTKPPKSEQIAEKHYCSCYIGRQKRGAV